MNDRAVPQAAPRARSERIVVRQLDGEVLVYDRERHRASCLNAFAADVWARCDGQSSPSLIAQKLTDARQEPVDERAVWLALDQLSRSRLLDEPVALPPSVGGATNRRALLRALGIGAAAVIPAVTTIMVPTVADAQSCFGDGAGCAIDAQCCSFNCNGGVCGPPL